MSNQFNANSHSSYIKSSYIHKYRITKVGGSLASTKYVRPLLEIYKYPNSNTIATLCHVKMVDSYQRSCKKHFSLWRY